MSFTFLNWVYNFRKLLYHSDIGKGAAFTTQLFFFDHSIRIIAMAVKDPEKNRKTFSPAMCESYNFFNDLCNYYEGRKVQLYRFFQAL